MNTPAPAHPEFDELISCFDAVFTGEPTDFATGSAGQSVDFSNAFAGPTYSADVQRLFTVAAREPWRDPDYRSKGVERFIEHPTTISSASLADIKALLTHCVRGERFSDGYWLEVLENGQMKAIYERLKTLRSQIPT